MGKYNEDSVAKSLMSNSDIRINKIGKVVELIDNSASLGNSTWGKIDFLTKYCGYTVCKVESFNKPKKKKKRK